MLAPSPAPPSKVIPHMMKVLSALSLTAFVLAAGCQDLQESPTAASPAVPADLSRSASAVAVGTSDHAVTLDDVRGRLMSGITDPGAAAALRNQIDNLGAALDAGDTPAAKAAIASARRVMDPAGDGTASEVGDPANIAAIMLLLDNLDQSLGS